MTKAEREALALLREEIGPRSEFHHPMCGVPTEACDCYMKGREEAHAALDVLKEGIRRRDRSKKGS